MSANYAQEYGFADDRERFKLILSVPRYQQAELERWLDSDGRKETLLAILRAKRRVGE